MLFQLLPQTQAFKALVLATVLTSVYAEQLKLGALTVPYLDRSKIHDSFILIFIKEICEEYDVLLLLGLLANEGYWKSEIAEVLQPGYRVVELDEHATSAATWENCVCIYRAGTVEVTSAYYFHNEGISLTSPPFVIDFNCQGSAFTVVGMMANPHSMAEGVCLLKRLMLVYHDLRHPFALMLAKVPTPLLEPNSPKPLFLTGRVEVYGNSKKSGAIQSASDAILTFGRMQTTVERPGRVFRYHGFLRLAQNKRVRSSALKYPIEITINTNRLNAEELPPATDQLSHPSHEELGHLQPSSSSQSIVQLDGEAFYPDRQCSVVQHQRTAVTHSHEGGHSLSAISGSSGASSLWPVAGSTSSTDWPQTSAFGTRISGAFREPIGRSHFDHSPTRTAHERPETSQRPFHPLRIESMATERQHHSDFHRQMSRSTPPTPQQVMSPPQVGLELPSHHIGFNHLQPHEAIFNSDKLKLGTFYIPKFTDSKMSNDHIFDMTVDLIKVYDIFMIHGLQGNDDVLKDRFAVALESNHNVIVSDRNPLIPHRAEKRYMCIYHRFKVELLGHRSLMPPQSNMSTTPYRVEFRHNNNPFTIVGLTVDVYRLQQQTSALKDNMMDGLLHDPQHPIALMATRVPGSWLEPGSPGQVFPFGIGRVEIIGVIRKKSDNKKAAILTFGNMQNAVVPENSRIYSYPLELKWGYRLAKKVSGAYPIEIVIETSRLATEAASHQIASSGQHATSSTVGQDDTDQEKAGPRGQEHGHRGHAQQKASLTAPTYNRELYRPSGTSEMFLESSSAGGEAFSGVPLHILPSQVSDDAWYLLDSLLPGQDDLNSSLKSQPEDRGQSGGSTWTEPDVYQAAQTRYIDSLIGGATSMTPTTNYYEPQQPERLMLDVNSTDASSPGVYDPALTYQPLQHHQSGTLDVEDWDTFGYPPLPFDEDF